MQLRNTVAAICIAGGALFTAPASAVVVSSFTAAPGTIVTDFSSAGLAAINLDLSQPHPATTISFQIEQADLDLGNTLSFNAVIANLFGQGIERFLLTLSNATFASIGSVETFFGSAASVSGSGDSAAIDFAPPDSFGFNIGDPFGTGGQDWTLNIAGLAVGDNFAITFAVPEPGSLPLVLAALLGAGWIGTRRRGGRN